MKRKTSNKTASIIYFVTAIIFFILFFKDKNTYMLAFGLVFTTFGFTYLAKSKKE